MILKQLVDRLPPNFNIVEKVQYFSPVFCFKTKAQYRSLPQQLLPDGQCEEVIKNKWTRLQNYKMEDIYGDKKDLNKLDAVDFWTSVS